MTESNVGKEKPERSEKEKEKEKAKEVNKHEDWCAAPWRPLVGHAVNGFGLSHLWLECQPLAAPHLWFHDALVCPSSHQVFRPQVNPARHVAHLLDFEMSADAWKSPSATLSVHEQTQFFMSHVCRI